MYKINRQFWHHLSAGKESGFYPETQANHVRLAKPAALYARYDDGEEVLIGYGHDHKFHLEEIDCVVWSPVQGSYYQKPSMVYRSENEVFTNFDKRPTPTALEQSLSLALRRLKSEQKRFQDEQRAAMAARTESKPDLAAEPEPAAVNEPPSEEAVEE